MYEYCDLFMTSWVGQDKCSWNGTLRQRENHVYLGLSVAFHWSLIATTRHFHGATSERIPQSRSSTCLFCINKSSCLPLIFADGEQHFNGMRRGKQELRALYNTDYGFDKITTKRIAYIRTETSIKCHMHHLTSDGELISSVFVVSSART